ncbi:MAG: hypothetical protein K2K31_01005 [Clostridia bacterium]|nr:hypothetical protein [Clostridia bacterium]
MLAFLIVILVLIVGVSAFYIWKEYFYKGNGKKKGEKLDIGGHGVMKNKKAIEGMVANVESIIVYANGNDTLCNRLVEAKDNIRFFNPTTNQKALAVDAKLASKLDDLKIAVAKDNTQETCFRLLEEVEAYIVQRKKEEQI